MKKISEFEKEKLLQLLECTENELDLLTDKSIKILQKNGSVYDVLLKILQQGCNNKRKAENQIAVDGGIGPNTIKAAANLKDWELKVERSGFYWNLVFDGAKYTKRTSQVKFIRGWIRRCFNLNV